MRFARVVPRTRARRPPGARCAALSVLGLSLTALAGCAQVGATSPARHAVLPTVDASWDRRADAAEIASPCVRTSTTRRADAVLAAAAFRYQQETSGSTIHADVQRIAADPLLLAALQRNRFGRALTEARRQLVQHVVRIRVLRGSRVVVDANHTSFDVAGSSMVLRGRRGERLGTLMITVQDVIGFIKLIDRRDGASAVVVRGSRGHLSASSPLAAAAALAPTGCVTLAGHAYVVRTLRERSFTGEPLTIRILVAA
jgi:hypothetical protein